MRKPNEQKMFPNAKEVVNDPARFADKPGQRLLAWAVLMGERGKRVNQIRLYRMQRRQLRDAVNREVA